MGDYSIVCSITGLPITSHQKVVGIGLERYTFWKDRMARHMWVPTTFPFFGEYDYAGGIEGENCEKLPKHCAIMHLAAWENSEQYWHHLNNKNPLDLTQEDVKEILKKATTEKEMCALLKSDRNWKMEDYVYHALCFYLQYTHISDYWLVLRDLFDGRNVSRAGREKGNSFLKRNKFAQIICEKIAKGVWTQTDYETVVKITSLFCGEKIIGKYIAPSEPNGAPYIEQYPDYKQRIEVTQFTLDLANKLKAERERKE